MTARKFHLTIDKVLMIAAFTLVFSVSSCGKKDNNAAKRFKDAAMNLDKTTHTLVDEYDYWPDCGIRITGSHLASLISLNDLKEILPCPLYVTGPHKNGQWDLHNEEEFGHYNPEAIEYLTNIAKKVVSDEQFVQMSKPLVDKYLYRQMFIMMVLHDAFYDTIFINNETRELVFNDLIENKGFSVEVFPYLDLDIDDETYLFSDIGNQFIYFWARRWKDGTINQFYDGLSTIFKAYHPEYVFDYDKYVVKYDYEDVDLDDYDYDYDYEEYEFGETQYNCVLDPDTPIENSERIQEKNAIDMVCNAVSNLNESFNVLSDEYDYWPDCGLRITVSHLFSLIQLRTFNRMLPCDLYLSGPHSHNRWEFHNPNEFGHYNPEAIKYLGQMAKKILKDKKFVNNTRPLVENNLKRQMHILIELYKGLNNSDICNNKEEIFNELIENRGDIAGEASSEFLDKLDLNDDSFVYSNTGHMFLYFWARRDADNTIDLFYEALTDIYSAYFPNE